MVTNLANKLVTGGLDCQGEEFTSQFNVVTRFCLLCFLNACVFAAAGCQGGGPPEDLARK
jgi:hypothetical protein